MSFMADYDELQRGIGLAVQEVRTIRGMTQKDLADIAGLTTNYISNLENGHRGISIRTLNRVAGILKVPAQIFVGLNAPDEPGFFYDVVRQMRVLLRTYLDEVLRR